MINHCVHQVENFHLHQKNLIDLINEIPQNRFDNISHTDWNLPDNTKRDYVEYFKKFILNDFIENSKDFFKGCPEIDISKLWFQVYRKNDFHEEHTHARTHFTNVFYIQLPDQNVKTKIKMHDGNDLSFEVKEGQILTFPAYWRHSSPINKSDKEKIIISFNLDCVCPSI